jgi:NADH-quinone oxidoreductase subunit J
VLLGLGLAVLLGTGLFRALEHRSSTNLDGAGDGGTSNVNGIANLIFSKYIFAFEATSALLITAALGAMVLAHVQRKKGERPSQPEKMRARFAPGNYPAPKPGPGVFATSDSVATPARLPDGTPAQRSISEILAVRELSPSEVALKPTLTGKDDDQ